MTGVSASEEYLPPTSDQVSSPLWLAAGAALWRWAAGPPSPACPPPASAWACRLLLRGCRQPTSGRLLLCAWPSRQKPAWALLLLLLLPPTIPSSARRTPWVTFLPLCCPLPPPSSLVRALLRLPCVAAAAGPATAGCHGSSCCSPLGQPCSCMLH
jgi:hypothetical protein